MQRPGVNIRWLGSRHVSSTIWGKPIINSGAEATLATMAQPKYDSLMSTRETLVAEINRFLKKQGMAADTFGKLAMNDVAFVYRLRKGLDPKASTIDKVRDFMKSYARPLAARVEARSVA